LAGTVWRIKLKADTNTQSHVLKVGEVKRYARLCTGVTKFLKPSVAGFLLQKELDYLDGAVTNPKRPFVAIVGGSKVSSKIGVIESLINKVDKIILGCAMLPWLYLPRHLSLDLPESESVIMRQ
jgi:3-phosphoglycerate kinase